MCFVDCVSVVYGMRVLRVHVQKATTFPLPALTDMLACDSSSDTMALCTIHGVALSETKDSVLFRTGVFQQPESGNTAPILTILGITCEVKLVRMRHETCMHFPCIHYRLYSGVHPLCATSVFLLPDWRRSRDVVVVACYPTLPVWVGGSRASSVFFLRGGVHIFLRC